MTSVIILGAAILLLGVRRRRLAPVPVRSKTVVPHGRATD